MDQKEAFWRNHGHFTQNYGSLSDNPKDLSEDVGITKQAKLWRFFYAKEKKPLLANMF